jgi:allantoicase
MTAAERQQLPDLAAERLGGVVIAANDDFFAPKENLLKLAAPVFLPDEFTDHGKWMDGWETRRRREPGHDWCVIRLGLPGSIRTAIVDTAFFTGNYPEQCSLEVAALPAADESAWEGAAWTELLAPSDLSGDTKNVFQVERPGRWTHVRFNIFPDGGVARLRLHGEVVPDWAALDASGGPIDVAALANGGRIVAQSDAFYGNANNMLQPGRSTHMADGWETRRRRVPGNEWAVVRLGRPGVVRRVEIDLDHFKGNAPGSISLESCVANGDDVATADWRRLVGQQAVEPHGRHTFDTDAADDQPMTHVRLSIYPDGGVARLRLFST